MAKRQSSQSLSDDDIISSYKKKQQSLFNFFEVKNKGKCMPTCVSDQNNNTSNADSLGCSDMSESSDTGTASDNTHESK